MAKGGMFGQHRIRHFNGHLFEDTTVFELDDDERRTLAEAAEADWQFVEPSIMGTIFARGFPPCPAPVSLEYCGVETLRSTRGLGIALADDDAVGVDRGAVEPGHPWAPGVVAATA